ncbi:MAG: hypothetical protein KAY24_15120 [Candidatus Eisenbacteria sp.]|nr:hypothetical protein [Candidatus Eisenbacteria bacterium]
MITINRIFVLLTIMMLGLSLFVWGCDEDDIGENQPFEGNVCSGEPSECFNLLNGWAWEGKAIDEPYLFDVTVIRLDDGKYRLYGGAPDNPHAVNSYISDDGLNFQKEEGYRLTEAFMPFAVKLTDGKFRLYYTDQETSIGEYGGRAIMSAISDSGLTFAVEEGDRLTYTGDGYELSGIRGAKILQLNDGSYRMYYHGIDANSYWRVLSAVSNDGLNWTRDQGVRIDPSDLCPPQTGIGNMGPFISSDGIVHLYLTTSKCDDMNYSNDQGGIFDVVSADGLTFTICDRPVIETYYLADSYAGNPGDPKAVPQDAAVIMTDNGLRMYFGVYSGPTVIDESAIYSIVNQAIE